jgi:hypothetical protein
MKQKAEMPVNYCTSFLHIKYVTNKKCNQISKGVRAGTKSEVTGKDSFNVWVMQM